MARKEITTPLDLNNMNNHNQNYKELYNEIQTTDKRLSENMWEEIKGANTMKMLEPVQTSDQLPATAEDKSLITVIDEQKVYAYVHDEWQPFNEIDLDPFEPFKKELAEIVLTYESKIQSITQEVQSTKDSAIDSIESTQSQSESNIENTKQSAINSVNKAQQEAESQIGETTEALKGKTSELTTMFNDYLEQLTSNRDTTLVEVENAKQDALDAINDFQSVDTSDWQKHKLTEDDGYIPRIDNADMSDLDSFMEINSKHVYLFDPINTPTLNDDNGYLTIIARSSTYAQAIFSPINDNTVYMNNKIGSSNGWDGWEKVNASQTDTGWVPFDLINGAVGDTAFKNSGDNGFNCAYRIIEKDGVTEKKLRINAKHIVHRQIIAQLPEGFAKNLQYHFVRVPADLGLNGMIGIYPNGKIYIYVNSDKQAEWESRSGDDVYFYGEVNWVD